MIRFLTAVLLFASFHVVAEDLKTFSDGQVIEADDFNHNFQKLEQDIANGVTGPQGEQGPVGPQGEQGQAGPQGNPGVPGNDGAPGDQGVPGNDGAPGIQGEQGLAGVAAGLICSTNQIIKYDGTAWVCSSPELRILNGVFAQGGTLNCLSGEKVTGGGCRIIGLDYCEVTQSWPSDDLSGWRCEAAGFVECQVQAIYAIGQ